MLLSVTADSRPTIIRCADGFEKRYLHRCGRCKVVLGYTLDEAHFATENERGGFDRRGNGGEVRHQAHGIDGKEKVGRGSEMVKVLYLLPGGLMSTEDMVLGKTIAVED